MSTISKLRRLSMAVASVGATLALAPATAAAQHPIAGVVVEAPTDPNLQRAA